MSVIDQAVKTSKVAFEMELEPWTLSECSKKVVDKMLHVTLRETFGPLDPSEADQWWLEYEGYAIKHACLIARIARALSKAGGRDAVYADDLVEACDTIVVRAQKVCKLFEHQRQKIMVGCTSYTKAKIEVPCTYTEPKP